MLFLSVFTTIITAMVLILLVVSISNLNKQNELNSTYLNTMFVLSLPMILGVTTIWILYSNLG